nr:immunoglobulin heavy chain junction region [Mus musculus]
CARWMASNYVEYYALDYW